MTLQYRGTNFPGGNPTYTDYPSTTGPVQATATGGGGQYLFVTTKDIDYCCLKGMNCFRVLFSWEALQPQPRAVLANLTGNFKTYFDKLKATVDYITNTKKANVVLDIHGGPDTTFAAYYGVKVGQAYQGIPVTDLLVDLWKQLATLYKNNPRVMFGITNEPQGLPTMTWFSCAQALIYAIRKVGAFNKILMPGNYFSGASSWTYTGSIYDTGTTKRSNAYGWENANGVGFPLVDPANNLAVQVHMYFDANAGGGAIDIANVDVGVTRLKVVTDWARSRGLQVMLCEVGLSASNSLAAAAWQKTYDYMEANSDVILGFLFWAYGPIPWWANYQFTLCPGSNYTKDSAQMDLIEPALLAPATPSPTGPTQAQYDALKAERDTLFTNYNNLLSQIVTLNADKSTLQSQIAALQSQVAIYVDQITTITAQRDGYKDRGDILRASLTDVVAKIRAAADSASDNP